MKSFALTLVLCCIPLLCASHPLLSRVRKQLISELDGQLCDPRGAVAAPSNCPGVSYGRDEKLSFFSFGPNVCRIQSPSEVANVEFRYRIVTVTGAKGITGTTTYCLPECISGPRPRSYSPIITARCCRGFAYRPGDRGCAQALTSTTAAPPTTAPPTTAATTAPPTAAATTAPPTTADEATTASPTDQTTDTPSATPPATTVATTTLEPTAEAPTAVVEDMSKLVGECLFFSASRFHGILNLKQEDPLGETVSFGRLRNVYGTTLNIFVHEFSDISNNCGNIGGFFPRIGAIASARKSRYSYYTNASGKTVIPVALLIGRSLSIVDNNGRIQACCAVTYPMK